MSEQESKKIITTFRERLEIDAALRDLGKAKDLASLQAQSALLVARYGDDLIVPLLAALDSHNAQLRGGLGYVAAQLDPEKIERALRGAAYDRSLSDQARLSAITILERFLEVEPDAAMYAGMADPQSMALQSLQEVLAEYESDPSILLEYFRQLSFEPEDVLLTMVKSTRRLDGAAGVPLLSMFAQEPFLPAAEEALHLLGIVADPAAAQALQALLPTLAPALQPVAARSLQKLRLRGVDVPPLAAPPEHYRCLASPIDGQGNQALWFIAPTAEAGRCDLLQVMIAIRSSGVAAANGGYDVDGESLPPELPIGALHMAVLIPGQELPALLEAPFDYGRRRVQAALAENWNARQPTPLAYRLFNLCEP